MVIRVGIAGHSDLTEASGPGVRAGLNRVLGGYGWAGGLVGVSCLAPGADQLFAWVVLDLGGRLEVILPAPDYRAAQIDPRDAPRFDRLLAAASSVRVMGFQRSCRPAYMAASAAMLACVEWLVAVWDGQPAIRLGSTGDVVSAARELGLPTTIVWPPTTHRRSQEPRCAGRLNTLAGSLDTAE
jgi:hypothetical protein